MPKDFNDFLNQMDSKDWSKVATDIGEESKNKDGFVEKIIFANLKSTVTVLREYHDWLMRD